MNNLPELPKTLDKKEAKFGIKLRRWLEENPRPSCALELKQTTKDYIAFSEVKENQLQYGLNCQSDKGELIRVIGSNGEPDYIWCRNMPAYIVIRYPKGFVLIGTETFLLEKHRSTRKSLTWQRAKEISVITV